MRITMIAATLGVAWCQAASLPVIAIRNATIHPASGPVIERAAVVVRNGLIESVGASVSPPADAWKESALAYKKTQQDKTPTTVPPGEFVAFLAGGVKELADV